MLSLFLFILLILSLYKLLEEFQSLCLPQPKLRCPQLHAALPHACLSFFPSAGQELVLFCPLLSAQGRIRAGLVTGPRSTTLDLTGCKLWLERRRKRISCLASLCFYILGFGVFSNNSLIIEIIANLCKLFADYKTTDLTIVYQSGFSYNKQKAFLAMLAEWALAPGDEVLACIMSGRAGGTGSQLQTRTNFQTSACRTGPRDPAGSGDPGGCCSHRAS